MSSKLDYSKFSWLPDEAKKYKLSKIQLNFFRENPEIEWPLCECGCGKPVMIDKTDGTKIFRRFSSVECSRSSKTIKKEVLKFLSNKEWLKYQLDVLKKPKYVIASELGISTNPVNKWCKIHDIGKKKNKFDDSNFNINDAKRMYFDENKTLTEISHYYGTISETTIKKRLIEAGCAMRNSSECRKGRKIGTKTVSLLENKDEIISRYNQGETLISLAKYAKCDSLTLKRFLENIGIKVCLPNDRNNKNSIIVDLYINNKMSIIKIAEQLNLSRKRIKKVLLENNIALRERKENQKLSANTMIKVNIDIENMINEYNNKVPMEIIAKKYDCHHETIRRYLLINDVDLFHRRTGIEYRIKEILDRYNINYVKNHRAVLKGLELDFYVPDKNLAIEVNGIYYHSFFGGGKDKNYHINKHKLCLENGIKLYQFWESDINDSTKLSIIESMIKNSLGLTERKIYARKCDIHKISMSQTQEFLKENHIQGQASPGNSLGLYYNNELVSVLVTKNAKEEIIITRFCTLLNTVVIGGFSKLLSKLKGKIKTYSHNDIGNGDLYRINGFEQISENIDMWYTDYKKIYNRQKFMKNKIKNFENYDEKLTEIENMRNNKYDIIYKSGTRTWVLDK